MKDENDKRIWRAVYSILWNDPAWRSFSPETKLTFLNLRTGPQCNLVCLFQFYREAIEIQTGLSRRAIDKSLDTLCHRVWIKTERDFIWIIRGLEFDPNISLKNPKHVKAITNYVLSLPKTELVKDFISFYKLEIDYTIPYPEFSNTLSKKTGITETETETEREYILSGKPDPIPFKEIISYLNKKINRNYSPEAALYRRAIKARWNEGKRLNDFYAVVDVKMEKWGQDEKMVEYLRPQTLFGPQMDSYLQESKYGGSGSVLDPVERIREAKRKDAERKAAGGGDKTPTGEAPSGD